MTEPQKPTGGAADEVLADRWPDDVSAAAYDAMAQWAMKRAGDAEAAAQRAHQLAMHADTETDGLSFNTVAQALGADSAKMLQSSADFLNMSAWLAACASSIRAAKSSMAAAVTGHQAIHDAPLKQTILARNGQTRAINPAGKTQEEKDADLQIWQNRVGDAQRALESVLNSAERAVEAGPGNIQPPPGTKTPELPSVVDPTEFPATMPGTDLHGPENTNPELNNPPNPAAPVAPLDPSVYAPMPPAPLPPPTPQSPGGTAEGDPSPMGAGMGGMPMGGMPMGGMPMGGQPPQGAGGGQPGAGASPLVDGLGKLADSALAGGQDPPLTPERLEELIKESGLEGDDPDIEGLDLDGDGLPDVLPESERGPGQATPVLDPYSAANVDPRLNDPPVPQHLVSPSPATEVRTPEPERVSAPVTELSADINPPPAGTPSAASNANPGGAAGSPAAPPPGVPPPGAALGPYPPPPVGAVGGGAGMPMGPMAGMAAAAPPAPPTPGGPVLAAAVPAAAAAAAAGLDRPHLPPPPPRVSALPPEHALAEMHLASLVRVYGQAGWAATTIAVAVVQDGSGAPRYIAATSDALSLVPLGVAVPAGVELLGPLAAKDVVFHQDWGGNRRAARKLIAWIDTQPGLQLTYIVSSDTGAPATTADGAVTEVQQTTEESGRLCGGSPAITPRYQIPGLLIPGVSPHDVAQYLGAAIEAWGFSDVEPSDMAIGKVRVMGARWTDIRGRDPEVPAITATYLAAEGLAAIAAGRLDDAAASLAQLLPIRAYDRQPSMS